MEILILFLWDPADMVYVCDGNTEVNLPKSSLKGNKTALNSLSCIFLFLDLPNTTDFLCGASHTKTMTYHILLCIGNIFFISSYAFFARGKLCSNLLPFPSSARSPVRFFYLRYWELAHITYLPRCQHSDL